MIPSMRTARLTGAAYLGLAGAPLLGTLVIKPHLHNPHDPAATVRNILDNGMLAHLGVGFELITVIAQAVVAIGFYALFRAERPTAAYAAATFGIANALAILGSAAMLWTAVSVANTPRLTPDGDTAGTVALLYTISDSLWAAGAVFFGLWLIPMGWYMISTRRMPHVLGLLLVAGGVGYVLSALLAGFIPALPASVADALLLPAIVGELWTVGYLLICGIRSPRATLSRATA